MHCALFFSERLKLDAVASLIAKMNIELSEYFEYLRARVNSGCSE